MTSDLGAIEYQAPPDDDHVPSWKLSLLSSSAYFLLFPHCPEWVGLVTRENGDAIHTYNYEEGTTLDDVHPLAPFRRVGKLVAGNGVGMSNVELTEEEVMHLDAIRTYLLKTYMPIHEMLVAIEGWAK